MHSIHKVNTIQHICLFRFISSYMSVRENIIVEVKQSRYRPGVAQRVPGS
jgi:hypothetical protein